jgi:YbbR domain-containing protein
MRWITHNLGLKALALVLATALSAYVYYEVNYSVPEILYLPLQAEGLAKSLVLTSELPESVAVSVRGPYRSIRSLRSRHPAATLDLQGVTQAGDSRVQITVPHLGDVAVTHVEPGDLAVQVDSSKTVTLPVQVSHQGKLDERYAISDEKWQPQVVKVTGPARVVDATATALIQPDLTKINGEIDAFNKGTVLRMPVKLFSADNEPVFSPALSVAPVEVEYALSIVPRASIRVLKVIPAYTGTPHSDYILANIASAPKYIAVPMAAAPAGVSSVRTAPIDLAEKTKSFVAVPKLIYPFALPADSKLPREVEVTVEIVPLSGPAAGAMRVDVQVDGRGAGLEYVLTPPQLKVMSERLSLLSGTQRSEITATLDVAGLRPGEYRIVPQLRLPAALDDAKMIPNWITLTVIEKGR